MKFTDYILFDAINPELKATDKQGVIREMVQSLVDAGGIRKENYEGIVKAFIKREELGSTAIGRGIAMPYIKHPSTKQPISAVAISPEGVDFDSLGNEVVHLFVMTLSPVDNPGSGKCSGKYRSPCRPHDFLSRTTCRCRFSSPISTLTKRKEYPTICCIFFYNTGTSNTDFPMATASQIKTLIRSHYEADCESFLTVALQVAAHEARQGHAALAREIRTLIEHSRKAKPLTSPFVADEDGLFLEIDPVHRLSELIASDNLREKLKKIILEYRQKDKLESHGLRHRRRILLAGPPGTGKTMTASVIANELRLPLYAILMERVVTKYMGESSAKLRMVFDKICEHRGVYLFDEFDAIGAERGLGNDVGEMRRILNSFLQFVEQDPSDSIVIAATNNLPLLDQALFRRFDDVLYYDLPNDAEAKHLLENTLGVFRGRHDVSKLIPSLKGLSQAEIVLSCIDAKKEAILNGTNTVDAQLLEKTLQDRHSAFRAGANKSNSQEP